MRHMVEFARRPAGVEVKGLVTLSPGIIPRVLGHDGVNNSPRKVFGVLAVDGIDIAGKEHLAFFPPLVQLVCLRVPNKS